MFPEFRRRLAVVGCVTALLASAACGDAPSSPSPSGLDPAWFASASWDDGLALVNVYEGRLRHYGVWRDAQVRDYLVREFHDPVERTKRDVVRPDLVGVLKAHRMVAFETGTYGYRRATSLFFRRADGRLMKAVGSSQDGCGLTVQRFDDDPATLRFDSYWEGEGRGERRLSRGANDHFADELPFVLFASAEGRDVRMLPSLSSNSLRGKRDPPTARSLRRTARSDGAGVVVTVVGIDGAPIAAYTYDADGTLASWRVEGEEEFTRRASRRFAYWEKTASDDDALVGLGR